MTSSPTTSPDTDTAPAPGPAPDTATDPDTDTAVAPAERLPPASPQVVAEAVEQLTPRLRKRLDAAIERIADSPTAAEDGTVRIVCGEDAVVTLRPGPSGALTDAEAAQCSCLLAPRCLHRAAVLGACPVAAASEPEPAATHPPAEPDTATADAPAAVPPTADQVAAASALWSAAAAVLAAGAPAAGAVLQADLLRAAHTARLAGLLRAEAAALRTVRGLRAARARYDGHRTADLVAALRELLLVSARLAAADPDPALLGTGRRDYRPGGSLRVLGLCREPVISATGYGGVVTHLLAEDGRRFTVADVKPGGPARARGAATAPVALSTALNHAQLARGGLLISGATVSPDGRLGAGRSVRAHPVPGVPWSAEPVAALFARSPAEAVAAALAAADDHGGDGSGGGGSGGGGSGGRGGPEQLIGCDLLVIGASGDRLTTRRLDSGTVVRLAPASHHPDLAHTANLRLLGSRPGLHLRVLGRPDLDRTATLRPLAVGPVPGSTATLRLPEEWLGRADLGYDRLQGAQLPPAAECPSPPEAPSGLDPLADSPLWRVRRLVELAVTGGRRAAAEAGRGSAAAGQSAALRRTGFPVAAGLAAALTAEADRRGRDVFGRLTDPGPDRYARAWLAAAVHLTTAERAVVRASWSADSPS